jgi:hypothetical protein
VLAHRLVIIADQLAFIKKKVSKQLVIDSAHQWHTLVYLTSYPTWYRPLPDSNSDDSCSLIFQPHSLPKSNVADFEMFEGPLRHVFMEHSHAPAVVVLSYVRRCQSTHENSRTTSTSITPHLDSMADLCQSNACKQCGDLPPDSEDGLCCICNWLDPAQFSV